MGPHDVRFERVEIYLDDAVEVFLRLGLDFGVGAEEGAALFGEFGELRPPGGP